MTMKGTVSLSSCEKVELFRTTNLTKSDFGSGKEVRSNSLLLRKHLGKYSQVTLATVCPSIELPFRVPPSNEGGRCSPAEGRGNEKGSLMSSGPGGEDEFG